LKELERRFFGGHRSKLLDPGTCYSAGACWCLLTRVVGLTCSIDTSKSKLEDVSDFFPALEFTPGYNLGSRNQESVV